MPKEIKYITFDDKNISSIVKLNRILTDNNINEIKSVVNTAITSVNYLNYLSLSDPSGKGLLQIDDITVPYGTISGWNFYSTQYHKFINPDREEEDPYFKANSSFFVLTTNFKACSTLLSDTISALEDKLNTDYYTYWETNIAISRAIEAASHLKYEIVSELPPIEEAKDNTIYLVPTDSPVTEQSNIYDEYMAITTDGVKIWERIGSTRIDISNFVTYTGENRKVLSGDIIIDGKIYANDLNLLDNYYTNSEVDNLISDVENKIPINVSELNNDIPYASACELIANKITYSNTKYTTVKAALDHLLHEPFTALFNVEYAGSYLVGTQFEKSNITWSYSGTDTNIKLQILKIDNMIISGITDTTRSYEYNPTNHISSNIIKTYTFNLTAENNSEEDIPINQTKYIKFNKYNFYFTSSIESSIIERPDCETILGNAIAVNCDVISTAQSFIVNCEDEYYYFAIPKLIYNEDGTGKFKKIELLDTKTSTLLTSYKVDKTVQTSIKILDQEAITVEYIIYRSEDRYGAVDEPTEIKGILKFFTA